eukprot:SAG11_NODE_21738_length_419_cov_1.621875_1_plen_88_part_10
MCVCGETEVPSLQKNTSPNAQLTLVLQLLQATRTHSLPILAPSCRVGVGRSQPLAPQMASTIPFLPILARPDFGREQPRVPAVRFAKG